MALGDPTSFRIRPDGFTAEIVLDGFTSGVTSDFNYTGNNIAAADTPYVTRTSPGFTLAVSANKVKRVNLTRIIRYPHSTSSIAGAYTSGTFADDEVITQATTNATAIVVGAQSAGPVLYVKWVSATPAPDNSNVWNGAGGGVFTPSATPSLLTLPTNDAKSTTGTAKVLVGLSEYVWDDCTATLTTFAGNFVNAGGSSENSNAVTAMAVTNDSALDYPTVIGQWDHIAGVCTADRVTGEFYVAFNARVPLIPLTFGTGNIDCVILTATGLTSGQVTSVTVTEETLTQRTGTKLYGWSHRAPFPVTGFTAGESIDLRARAYPIIGDANSVLDTNNYTTADDEPLGSNKATIKYITAAKTFAAVGTGGSDVGAHLYSDEASAVADPYATLGEAIKDGANEIILLDPTTSGLGSTPPSRVNSAEWVVVRPATGQSSATRGFQLTNANATYRCSRLQFQNLTISVAATNAFLSGEDADNCLRFKECHFDSSGVAETIFPFTRLSNITYLHNCTGDLSDDAYNLGYSGAERVAWHADGCQFRSATAGLCRAWYRLMACDIDGGIGFAETGATSASPNPDNLICENNRFRNFTGSNITVEIGNTKAVTRGASIMNNSFEKQGASAPSLWIAADSSTVDVHNILCCNNSAMKERWSICYNDNGSVIRNRKNWVFANNLSECIGTKHDDFQTSLNTTITRSGTTATATAPAAHGLSTGDIVVISGITNHAVYNGTFSITVTSSTQFTYTIASDPGGSGTGVTVVFRAGAKRIGGWSGTHGCQWHGNFSAQINGVTGAGQFCNEWIGENGYQPAITAGSQPPSASGGGNVTDYVNWLVRPASGAGNQLFLKETSPAITTNPRHTIAKWDALGHRRQSTGLYAAAGAFVNARTKAQSTGVTTTRSTGVSSVKP